MVLLVTSTLSTAAIRHSNCGTIQSLNNVSTASIRGFIRRTILPGRAHSILEEGLAKSEESNHLQPARTPSPEHLLFPGRLFSTLSTDLYRVQHHLAQHHNISHIFENTYTSRASRHSQFYLLYNFLFFLQQGHL